MDTFRAPARSSPASCGEERDQLESWLDFYRGTLLYKCDGLSADQLKARPVATSTLSLLGMVRHLTFVEQTWFEVTFAGRDVVEYYKATDNRDSDFSDLDGASVEDVFNLFNVSVAMSRELAYGQALEEMATKPRRGIEVDLRWIYIHMIEEYARHCGHVDILRELIDGATGY